MISSKPQKHLNTKLAVRPRKVYRIKNTRLIASLETLVRHHLSELSKHGCSVESLKAMRFLSRVRPCAYHDGRVRLHDFHACVLPLHHLQTPLCSNTLTRCSHSPIERHQSQASFDSKPTTTIKKLQRLCPCDSYQSYQAPPRWSVVVRIVRHTSRWLGGARSRSSPKGTYIFDSVDFAGSDG